MKKNKGFTLIEMLTVVLIVAILTAVALPQYRNVVEKGRAAEAQSMLRNIYDSSERLAAEFGYRSYEKLIAAKGNESNYSFARLDMFDANDMPTGCEISYNTTLKCTRFFYKIAKDGYVVAKKRTNPHVNTYILLKRDTLELFCLPPSGDTDACDVYGLDQVAGSPSVTF